MLLIPLLSGQSHLHHLNVHVYSSSCSRRIPQATDLQSSPSTKACTSSLSTPPTGPCSSSLHFKVRTGSHISSSLKNSLSPSSRGPGRPTPGSAVENSGGGSFARAHPEPGGKPSMVRPVGLGRHKNPVGRPSKQMMKLREEATTAATVRKRKAPSQEGEHSGPDRNCIVLQDRGRPHSSPSSSKTPPHSLLPHGQTNGTLSPSGKPRPPPHPSDSHSPAAKALWTYRRTHPPTLHSSHPEPLATTNSHCKVGPGEAGLHSGGRGFEQQGLLKKRKLGGLEEPSSKPPAQRPPSSSSSSQRSNFYSWKDSKGGGLAGGVEKKLSAQKVCVRILFSHRIANLVQYLPDLGKTEMNEGQLSSLILLNTCHYIRNYYVVLFQFVYSFHKSSLAVDL